MSTNFRYQSGFGNFFESEALEDSLPKGKNSPQRVNFGLYAEQLSGSAFTMARKSNLRSWLYRIRPSVVHGSYKKFEKNVLASAPLHRVVTPEQYRWSPRPRTGNRSKDGWAQSGTINILVRWQSMAVDIPFDRQVECVEFSPVGRIIKRSHRSSARSATARPNLAEH